MRWLVAGLLVLVCVTRSDAAEREYWRHSKGHFENTEKNKWTEKAPNGETYHFIEVKRTEHYVELHDKGRDCTVRLHNTECEVKFGDGKFERYYEGKWGGK
jgi:hypothetical protein